MTRTTVKFLVAGVVLVAAVAYLAYAGMKEGWASYHMPVDQFVASTQFHNQNVRLAGMVGNDGLVAGAGKLGAEFNLVGQSQHVRVAYAGVVPDLFKPGCEVVVEGRLDSAGVFRADTLMTKCASKYDSAAHGQAKTEKQS